VAQLGDVRRTRIMILVGYLMYFGALIIPAAYLLSTRWHGTAKRPVLIGVGLQIFWSLVVWGIVIYSHRAGYSEWFYAWAYLLPVNIVSFIYYLAVIYIYDRKTRE